MPTRWQLFTEDPQERARFADLAAVRTFAGEPAGPPNRLRQVTRIRVDGSTYYLKAFTRTQWKNRLHFLLTRPRASDDAERERRVTEALRQAGYAAPRPVAQGRAGASSFYLCAELAGEPLADRLRRGDVDAVLARRVAEHCGRLLAAGFSLPDLSADHVFVDADHNLAVLDLHNGGTGPAGRPRAKLLRRVLRRFARSVRDLPVDRRLAMSFATRLMRSAGVPRSLRRRLLTGAQPFGTAARYERPGRSQRYAQRNPERAAREHQLLARVWPGRPGETVLDLPCGTGRLLPWLAERGHRAVQADGALAMLQQAHSRGTADAWQVQADALRMPFADGAVDGVVMFRFLHHLPPDSARTALAEACRVARRFVVVSFFHPFSAHHLRRRLRHWLGQPATRFALTLGDVRAAAERHGFLLHAHTAQLAFARDLWLAAFAKHPSPAGH